MHVMYVRALVQCGKLRLPVDGSDGYRGEGGTERS